MLSEDKRLFLLLEEEDPFFSPMDRSPSVMWLTGDIKELRELARCQAKEASQLAKECGVPC